MQLTEYGINTIHNFSTVSQKEIGYINDYGWKSLTVHVTLFYEFFKRFQFKMLYGRHNL